MQHRFPFDLESNHQLW